MALWDGLVNHLLSAAIVMAVTVAVLLPLELRLSPEPQSIGSRAMGLLYWALVAPVAFAARDFAAWLLPTLGIRPLLTIPAGLEWMGAAAAVASPILVACLSDFFFYWYHRILHRWLWRVHAVHHAIRDMNAVNSYHHISDDLFRVFLLTFPASLVVYDVGPALPIMTILLTLYPAYVHSPAQISLGPLRAVFVDNRFHRIHHSLEPQHFDKNFGAFTTLWDRLFGTAYFPAPQEWPAIGLPDVDEPRTVRQWLDLPWRYGRPVAAPAPVPAE